MTEVNPAGEAAAAVPSKRRSRYINMGRTSTCFRVFSATDSSSEDEVPIPRQRKPRKSKTSKKYDEDYETGEDFEGGSSDEWHPPEKDKAPQPSKKKNRKKIKKSQCNPLKRPAQTRSNANISIPLQSTSRANQTDKKVTEADLFGAIPKYSRAQGRPFKGFQDDIANIFKTSNARSRIDDKVLEAILKMDKLKGRDIGPGPIPDPGPNFRLPKSEKALHTLLGQIKLPKKENGEKLSAKEATVSVVGQLVRALDPSIRQDPIKNARMVFQLGREVDKAAEEVARRKANNQNVFQEMTKENFKLTPEIIETLGFNEIPLLDDDDSSFSEFESDFEEEAKASGRNTGKWEDLTESDCKQTPMDSLVSRFLKLTVIGKSPKSFADWLKTEPKVFQRNKTLPGVVHTLVGDETKKTYRSGIKVTNTGVQYYGLCDEDTLPAGLKNAKTDKNIAVSGDQVGAAADSGGVDKVVRGGVSMDNSNVDGYKAGCWVVSTAVGRFQCPVSEYSAGQSSQLKVHVAVKHGSGSVEVEECQGTGGTTGHSLHAADVHRSENFKKFEYPHCEFRTVQSGDLKLHVAGVHGYEEDKKHKCPHCDYRTVTSGSLKIDVAGVHGGEEDKKHKCPHCDYGTVTSGNLKVHVAAVHGGEEDKKHKCPHCDYRTVTSGNLKVHVAAVHGGEEHKKHKCPHCDYRTVQSGNLKFHVASIHGGEEDKKHKCPHCDYRTVQSGSLKIHVASIHGGEEDKKHKCPHCDYRTVQSGSLKIHVASIHGGEEDKKHKCPHCDYRTVQSGSLKIHVAGVHGGEEDKKHKCPHCDYRTVTSGNLKFHVVRIHGGEEERNH